MSQFRCILYSERLLQDGKLQRFFTVVQPQRSVACVLQNSACKVQSAEVELKLRIHYV